MSFRNAFGIYQVLERLLKASDRPQTCVDLYDAPDVKKYVDDANRVSDYLGHMFRRGLLKRVPAPKSTSSMARWAYSWKDPKLGSPVARSPAPRLLVSNLLGRVAPEAKPELAITQDGDSVTVELDKFVLTITTKR